MTIGVAFPGTGLPGCGTSRGLDLQGSGSARGLGSPRYNLVAEST
jgi:hypothetical protein